jgi:hypothetical protein
MFCSDEGAGAAMMLAAVAVANWLWPETKVGAESP